MYVFEMQKSLIKASEDSLYMRSSLDMKRATTTKTMI